MYTRKQYLNKECTHDQYYQQFVTDSIKDLVSRTFGTKELTEAFLKDEHFNNIPIKKWDNLNYFVQCNDKLKKCGDYLTQAGQTCILKQAAKIIVKEGYKKMNKKTLLNLGKIDYNNTGKRVNLVTIEIELDYKNDDPNTPAFSVCGNIWNSRKSDILSGGQNLDEILELFPNNETVKLIYSLWEKYHLNDMHAGTEEQDEIIKAYLEKNNLKGDYDLSCKILKDAGLYEVEVNGEPYKYGHAWLYWPIPEQDLNKILSLFQD